MDEQYIKMTQTPVNRLIASLAVPTIISMMISSIYNLVDAYFVGKIGTSASGAIGIVLGLQGIIQAFGFMCGHGAGSIISRKLGAQDTESATEFASTSFFSAIGFGTLILALGLCFFDPMLRLLGSTDTILPYSRQYAFYILLAAPFMASSCVLNNIMRYEGHALFAMIGLASGGILNMILDPVLMFTMGWGVAGAGMATAISQVISFLILLYMFLSGRTQSKISIFRFTRQRKNFFLILQTGFPSLLRQGLNSVSTMALNLNAAVYGDAAIAAMSIVGRICMFVASIMIGIGQGLQPVAAYNYGAKKYKRVREGFKFTVGLGEVVLGIFGILAFLISRDVVRVFRDDPQVVAIGVVALRLQCISILVQPLGVCTNMIFQSIGENRKAAFVSILRSGLYFLPLIFILPRFMGILGVESAQMLADTLTFATALPMVVHYMKNLPQEDMA